MATDPTPNATQKVARSACACLGTGTILLEGPCDTAPEEAPCPRCHRELSLAEKRALAAQWWPRLEAGMDPGDIRDQTAHEPPEVQAFVDEIIEEYLIR